MVGVSDFQGTISGFRRPLTLKLHRNKYHELDKTIVKNRKSCDRFIACLNGVGVQFAAAAAVEKKKLADERNRLSAILRKSDIPPCLAKSCAAHLMLLSQDALLETPVGQLQLPQHAMKDRNCFGESQFIPFDEKTWIEGGTFWHKTCRAWFLDHKDELRKHNDDKIAHLRQQSLSQGCRALDTDPKLMKFSWSPTEGDGQWFKALDDIKVHQFTIKEKYFDIRPEAWMYTAHRGIVTMTNGCMIVVVLGEADVEGHVDLLSWLQSAHHASLAKCNAHLLSPGDSLYLPIGTKPLFVPVPSAQDASEANVGKAPSAKRHKSDDATQYVSFAFHLAFDRESDLLSSQAACRLAVTSYVGSLNWIPNSVRSNVGVIAWREALEAHSSTLGPPAAVTAGGQ